MALMECNQVLHSSKYKYEILVLYLSLLISCYFLLLHHYISVASILLFTHLHLSDSFSY